MKCDKEGVYEAILEEVKADEDKKFVLLAKDGGANADGPSDALMELGEMAEEMSEDEAAEMMEACEGACAACKPHEESDECMMCGGCMCMGAAHMCHESDGEDKKACKATMKCDKEGVYEAILEEVKADEDKKFVLLAKDGGANADGPSDALMELGEMAEEMSEDEADE